jgi:hypothetical protein
VTQRAGSSEAEQGSVKPLVAGSTPAPYAALSKREYFAAAALQGLCANAAFSTAIGAMTSGGQETRAVMAATAVAFSDALIAALERA